MEAPKILTSSLNFPCALANVSSKLSNNVSTDPQKFSPALVDAFGTGDCFCGIKRT